MFRQVQSIFDKSDAIWIRFFYNLVQLIKQFLKLARPGPKHKSQIFIEYGVQPGVNEYRAPPSVKFMFIIFQRILKPFL